ncbi:MAG: YlbF family regulator [Verrucomicrobiota bacterium]
MEVLSPNSAIVEKTRELCSLILSSSEYQENVSKIEKFFENDEAQTSYRLLVEIRERLQQKQQAGLLTQEDIAIYDEKMKELRADPVTSAFMEAEETLNGIVAQISKTVAKTLELKRLPEPEDMAEDGCCGGGGCGCS